MTIQSWTGAVRRRRGGMYVPVADKLRRITAVDLWDGTTLRRVYQYQGSEHAALPPSVAVADAVVPLKGLLAGNLNFDAGLAAGNYANYLAAVNRRMIGRMKGYREAWTTAIDSGANPSPPAYLSDCTRDLAAADPETFLIMNVYPANSNGLPGTWQYTPQFQSDGVTTNPTWTTAQTTLATWAGYDMAQTEANLSTFLANVAWSVCKKLEKTKAVVVLGQNEKNNPYIGSGLPNESNVSNTAVLGTTRAIPAYESILRDFPLTLRYTANAITLALKRWTVICKRIHEVKYKIGLTGSLATLRDSITHDWWYCDGVLPEQRLFGNYTGGSVYVAGGSGFPWGYADWNAIWNGAWQSYVEIVGGNKHRDDSKNTKFDGTELVDPNAPATDGNFSCNFWIAQEGAVALNGGSRSPILATEAGTYFGTVSSSAQASSDGAANGTWGVETGDAGVEIYPSVTNSRGTMCSLTVGRSELAKYRGGWYWVGKMWYGAIGSVHYSNAHSLSSGNNHWDSRTGVESLWDEAEGGDGLRFKPFPFWLSHIRHTDPQNFDAREWDPTFPTKDWTGFHDLATWAAFINMTRAPTGTPLTQPPYGPWNEYTFSGGVVEMRPWTTATYAGHQIATYDRMMIAKPVWLPYPNKLHRVEVDICFQNSAATATAQAKLEVRGFNKYNGLDREFAVVSGGTTSAGGGTGTNNWKRVAVEFQHVGHGYTGIPEANYALITLQFNNAGTWPVQFRNCTVDW